MQHQKVIEQLGYTAREAKIYLAALSLGEAHISDIAAKVKLPRTSVQVTVDKLHKDGLMNFYLMRRYKYWVAEKPERLLAMIQKREKAMREAIPELTALRKASRGNYRSHKNDGRGMGAFRMLADTALQPVLITDENIEITYVNVVWKEQFGYELHEVKGQNPRIFKSGETPAVVYEEMWATLQAGRLFQSDEIVDQRKDGTCFNLLTTIFPVEHVGNMFYIQILDDITEKKRVEKLQKKFTVKKDKQ